MTEDLSAELEADAAERQRLRYDAMNLINGLGAQVCLGLAVPEGMWQEDPEDRSGEGRLEASLQSVGEDGRGLLRRAAGPRWDVEWSCGKGVEQLGLIAATEPSRGK